MTTTRFCSHCGKELTDAVSLTLGIGPVCRGIENEVYANCLPVNETALASVLPVFFRNLTGIAPETQAVLIEAVTLLTSGERPSDLRKTVKQLDWCCSYQQPYAVREAIICTIAALGYPGLAGIIAGKSSTSEATVTAVNGKIVVKGAKNANAAKLFKAIKGWSFSGSEKTWSFSASESTAVKTAIFTAYPATKTDLAKVFEEASTQAAALAPKPAPVAPVAPVAPKAPAVTPVVVTETATAMLLKTAAMYPAFIAELKTLPYADRAWNLPAAPYQWTVAIKHKAFVTGLIAKHFPSTAAAA